MNKRSMIGSFRSSTMAKKAWKMTVVVSLLTGVSCISGCATTSSNTTAYNGSGVGTSEEGPAYYQSNDNPFHAD